MGAFDDSVALTGRTAVADAARACSRCAHAIRVWAGELSCGRSPALYPADDERAMSALKALLFDACGRSGRHFVRLGETDVASVADEH